MGFSSIRAQGLSAPPYLGAFFILLASTFMSDKLADRTIFIIPLAAIAGIGYLLLAIVKTTAVRYFAVFLAAGGLFPVIGLMLPLTSSLHEDDSKRTTAFLLLNTIGQTGPFLGTRLYPARDKCVTRSGSFFATVKLTIRHSQAVLSQRHGRLQRLRLPRRPTCRPPPLVSSAQFISQCDVLLTSDCPGSSSAITPPATRSTATSTAESKKPTRSWLCVLVFRVPPPQGKRDSRGQQTSRPLAATRLASDRNRRPPPGHWELRPLAQVPAGRRRKKKRRKTGSGTGGTCSESELLQGGGAMKCCIFLNSLM